MAFTLPPAAVITNYKLATFSCSLIKCMQFSFIPASLYKFIVYLPPPRKAKMLNISLAYLQWQNQKKKLRMVTDINILVKVSQSNKHTQNTHIHTGKGKSRHTYIHIKFTISCADKLAFDVGQKVMQIGFFRACLQSGQRGKNINCPRKVVNRICIYH